MFSRILSAFVQGIDVSFINVEVDVSSGLPGFDMVGYLGSEVKEARERVRTSLRNCGIKLPAKHITINLSPANIKKHGTGFDLSIAIAVLIATDLIPSDCMEDTIVLGELSLDGAVNPIRGVLPILAEAKKMGIKKCVLSNKNINEASLVEGMTLFGITTLNQIIDTLGNNKELAPANVSRVEFEKSDDGYMDFSQIAGQESAKRAAVIAAAGMHNLLLVGPPGAGKTMLSKAILGILPQMSMEESIEVTKIYSVAGLLEEKSPLVTKRPFRSPHHTVTASAMSGGGRIPRPGEMTLAHRGILFLDELPEYQRVSLEVLRQPMEEGVVYISRALGNFVYPANFMLVAAMNPCKCGNYPDFNKCTCTPLDVNRYLGKISRPLLDRIDLGIEMQPLTFEALNVEKKEKTSAELKKQVEATRKIQEKRNSVYNIQFNAHLTKEMLNEVCALGTEETEFMRKIYDRYDLTARSYHRILKVSRTIADLEGSKNIRCHHLSEAVCFRTMDKKFWNR